MTRGAWVGAGLSHLFYAGILLINHKLNASRAIIFIGVTLGVFLLYNGITSGSFLTRFLSIGKDMVAIADNTSIDQAGSSRMFIWIYVSKIIVMHPLLGVGIENLGVAFQAMYSQDIIDHFGRMVIPDKAHNEYLHIAATSGVFALGVYLTLLVSILKKGTHQLLEHPTRLVLYTAIIGYMIQAFFNISVVSVVYVFWIFLGLLATIDLSITNNKDYIQTNTKN
jgi:putative inorganic carbon (HCO3(-)) transporter